MIGLDVPRSADAWAIVCTMGGEIVAYKSIKVSEIFEADRYKAREYLFARTEGAIASKITHAIGTDALEYLRFDRWPPLESN